LSDAADAITTGPGVSYTACFILFFFCFIFYVVLYNIKKNKAMQQ